MTPVPPLYGVFDTDITAAKARSTGLGPFHTAVTLLVCWANSGHILITNPQIS